MKALKKHGFLQIIIGFASAILLLVGFYILGEKVTFPETAFWNIAEPVILVAFMLSYTAFLTLLAIFSKAYDLKFLYYPVFGSCLTSVISAIIYWQTETSFRLLTIFISKALGSPVLAFSQALEEATVYYNKYNYEETILWQYDTVGILLVITIISLAIYQLYTKTDEHAIKLSRWRMQGTTRNIALTISFSYGIYTLLIFVLNLSDNFIVSEFIYTIVAMLSMLCTITMVTFILPVILIPLILINATKQAIQSKNPRQLFNPLVFLAIFLTIAGTWAIYTTTMHCF